MKYILSCLVGVLALAGAASHALAAPTPADLCSSAVEIAASKFAACRLKAESTFSKTGKADKRTADLAKCSTKFLDAFDKATARYGVACPMVDPKEDFEAYLTQCTVETTAAADGAALPGCGNGSIDSAGEQCDGADLGGASCVSLGFTSGTLACSGGCAFDTSSCVQSACGNGTVDGGEQCDGVDLNGATCASLGYAGGTLGCSAGCGFDVASCDVRTLPSTGQVSCSDSTGAPIACAGTGQDGDTLAGSFAYTDNGDGTITDGNTGLVWEKLDDNNVAGIHDKDDLYTWDDAFAVKIAALNTVPCFAGHCDWRLPNLKELASLANYEVPFPGPAIGASFNSACTPGCTSDACSCTAADLYWTSTSYIGSPDFAWYVYFIDGNVLANQKTNSAYVRAVRSGS